MTGFLVEFGAEAAQVLGGGGGGVGGAGEAFAGALFVVESARWEGRLGTGEGGRGGRWKEWLEREENRYRLPYCFCQRSIYLLWVSGVRWVEARDGCAKVERTHFEAVTVSK